MSQHRISTLSLAPYLNTFITEPLISLIFPSTRSSVFVTILISSYHLGHGKCLRKRGVCAASRGNKEAHDRYELQRNKSAELVSPDSANDSSFNLPPRRLTVDQRISCAGEDGDDSQTRDFTRSVLNL